MDGKSNRGATELAVGGAIASWAKAPGHIKLMAGSYVGALLTALACINQELEDSRAARVAVAEAANEALEQHGQFLHPDVADLFRTIAVSAA